MYHRSFFFVFKTKAENMKQASNGDKLYDSVYWQIYTYMANVFF